MKEKHMSWTYGDPADERKDEVRLMVGDTDIKAQMLQDEEIEYLVKMYGPASGKPAWLAAAWACDAIAGKFGRSVQQSLGALSRSAQQQYEHYRELAAHYRMLYDTNGAGVSSTKLAYPVLGGGGETYLGGPSAGYSAGRLV